MSRSSKSSRSKPLAVTTTTAADNIELLPDSVPVVMPQLPAALSITTLKQFRALSDPTRTRILSIIQHQPATAKQIADRLNGTPGAIGHHLKVLEAAGLAQVVAKRVTRGIIAKYYTRAARLYNYDMPPELTGESVILDIFRTAFREFSEVVSERPDGLHTQVGFPRARLSEAKLQEYSGRITQLMNDFVAEPADPAGKVYSMCTALFESPSYVQSDAAKSEKRAAKRRTSSPTSRRKTKA